MPCEEPQTTSAGDFRSLRQGSFRPRSAFDVAEAHRLLGLPAVASDPVEIILAAHAILRGLRHPANGPISPVRQEQIRRVVAARELLLLVAVVRLRESNP